MKITWNTVAQAGLVALALVGCSDSHANDGDTSGTDGGMIDSSLIFDGGGVDTGTTDGGTADAGMLPLCTAERVGFRECEPTCDGPPSFHWNGDRCFPIGCGECVGEDCGAGTFSLEACEAAHAECVPQLCRTTGGDWLFWAEECEHRRCGQPGLILCEVGMPVCDCGLDAIFEDGVGCVPSEECPELVRPTREALCNNSGGTWEGVCCDSVCGQPCAAACLAPACTCGPMEIFDEARGCIEADECFERQSGEGCGDPRQRCAEGLLCCDRCGGAGCEGTPTCIAPVCSEDPAIDTCGNNRFAP